MPEHAERTGKVLRWIFPALLLAALIAALILLAACVLRQSSYDTKQMSVVWQFVGQPCSVRGSVSDSNGKPISGANVALHTDSGPTDVTTDAQGQFALEIGERNISYVEVKGVGGFRPRYGLGLPTDEGLVIHIVRKP